MASTKEIVTVHGVLSPAKYFSGVDCCLGYVEPQLDLGFARGWDPLRNHIYPMPQQIQSITSRGSRCIFCGIQQVVLTDASPPALRSVFPASN